MRRSPIDVGKILRDEVVRPNIGPDRIVAVFHESDIHGAFEIRQGTLIRREIDVNECVDGIGGSIHGDEERRNQVSPGPAVAVTPDMEEEILLIRRERRAVREFLVEHNKHAGFSEDVSVDRRLESHSHPA